ncbi:MAG: type II secretion system F family protein [Candidatus Pacebacteria bacterium]|nr:type II secretion system F family protein [Candidatus Paceibacterota bacterium]
MAIFKYSAIDKEGKRTNGEIEAVNLEVAISSLQKRGLTIASINPAEKEKKDIFSNVSFFNRISNKEIVILSRQIATLFGAQVSALQVFKLLGAETTNPALQKVMQAVSSDIQSGSTISEALRKHPKTFSNFYISMVKSGEEAGKLSDVFEYLADYLDRTFEVTSKAKSALIYPAFVILTFIAVIVIMLTAIIPRITTIVTETGQEIPIYTKIVIGFSEFFVNYGILLGIAVVIIGFILWRYVDKTEDGKVAFSQFRLGIPYVGDLYKKLYLSRIADNMNTMIVSGIPMVQSLETTAEVVDDKTYKDILTEAVAAVRSGSSVSKALSDYPEIPGIMVQMIKIGEETGELGKILETVASFYRREVRQAVDTLVDLIEPAMIIVLGLGVGILLAAVLLPIYSISSAF